MTIKARLARLEGRAPGRQKIYVWGNDGETSDEAVARLYPAGEPKNVELIIMCWADDPAIAPLTQ